MPEQHNRLGGVWSKRWKSGGKGFAGVLDAEAVERWLKDNPNEAKIPIVGFSNERAQQKNERAPDYVILLSERDGSGGCRGRGGSGGGRGEGRGRGEERGGRGGYDRGPERGRPAPEREDDNDPFDSGRPEQDSGSRRPASRQPQQAQSLKDMVGDRVITPPAQPKPADPKPEAGEPEPELPF